MSAPTWDTCLVCGAHGTHACPGVAAVIAGTKPAPSAEPAFAQVRAGILTLHGEKLVVRTRPSHEWGESEELSLDDLRLLLSRAGLAIVPASDVPSPEERKVLEVLGDVPNTLIDDWRRWPSGWLMLLAKAELARRAAKEKPNA